MTFCHRGVVLLLSVALVSCAAGIARAVLVGHSMGTPVVRQFYRLYPKKTVALVAVDGSLEPYTLDPRPPETFLRLPVRLDRRDAAEAVADCPPLTLSNLNGSIEILKGEKKK